MHDKLTYASIQDKGEGLPIIAAEDEETLNHMKKGSWTRQHHVRGN